MGKSNKEDLAGIAMLSTNPLATFNIRRKSEMERLIARPFKLGDKVYFREEGTVVYIKGFVGKDMCLVSLNGKDILSQPVKFDSLEKM